MAGFIRECAWGLLYGRSAVPFWSVVWSNVNRPYIAEEISCETPLGGEASRYKALSVRRQR